MTDVLPLSKIAEEQARSNQGLEGEKIIKEYGIYALIPESMTLPGQDHESETNNHSTENLRESCSYQHTGRSQSVIDDVEWEG